MKCIQSRQKIVHGLGKLKCKGLWACLFMNSNKQTNFASFAKIRSPCGCLAESLAWAVYCHIWRIATELDKNYLDQWWPTAFFPSPLFIVKYKIWEKFFLFIMKNLFPNICLSPHLKLLSPHVANGDRVGQQFHRFYRFRKINSDSVCCKCIFLG